MYIHCLGVSHHTSEVSLREKLAFTVEGTRAALARLGCGSNLAPGSVSEMVIISTCNRVEIYAVALKNEFEALEEFLADASGVSLEEFKSSLYRLANDDAIKHILNVAAGLDSLVLGEPQILGQVTDAFELARGQDAIRKVLSQLFHAAIYAGRRARSETKINHNPASISSQAVSLANQLIPNLPDANVVVLGAGEMARLAVESLQHRGVSNVTVVNRTLERAQKLASRLNGTAMTFEKLPEVLEIADILITSTAAPHTLISKQLVQTALSQHPERRLAIFDVAVPRDVDDDVDDLAGVTVYDIDSLNGHLEDSLIQRKAEEPHVKVIVAEEFKRFKNYLRTLDVIPIISELHQLAESIRQEELERTIDRLSCFTPDERAILESMTQALVKKILHAPITRLRQEAGTSNIADYAIITRDLFELNGHS